MSQSFHDLNLFDRRLRELLEDLRLNALRRDQIVFGHNMVHRNVPGTPLFMDALHTPGGGGGDTGFHAQITATAAIGASDSRWVYTIEEVTIEPTISGGSITDVNVTTVAGGRTGSAINLAELRNQADTGIAFGMDRAGADYPDAAPRPITGGGTDNTHQLDQVVWIHGHVKANDDSRVWVFDRQGTHDGICPA